MLCCLSKFEFLSSRVNWSHARLPWCHIEPIQHWSYHRKRKKANEGWRETQTYHTLEISVCLQWDQIWKGVLSLRANWSYCLTWTRLQKKAKEKSKHIIELQLLLFALLFDQNLTNQFLISAKFGAKSRNCWLCSGFCTAHCTPPRQNCWHCMLTTQSGEK